MRKYTGAALALAVVAALIIVVSGSAATAASPKATVVANGTLSGGDVGTDQMIVHLKTSARPATAELGASTEGSVETVRRLDDGSYVLKLPETYSTAAANALAAEWMKRPDVAYAEPDSRDFVQTVPDDTRYGDQWDMQPVTASSYGANLPPAWSITTGSAGVVVAVIDSGILPHPDLAGRVLPGYDFISDVDSANDGNGRDADATDPGDWITAAERDEPGGPFEGCTVGDSEWHGTHVAGTVGAKSNNSLGVAGVNWTSMILPVRALGKCGGAVSDIADGIRWAAGLSVSGVPANPTPASVINMSLGSHNPCNATYQNAIDAATAAGVLIVVSAGNSNEDVSLARPANCNNTVAVAASAQNGNRAYYSNYGSGIDITAPGGDFHVDSEILSTLNSGTTTASSYIYDAYQGTSMAAPHVAGVASLIKSVAPTASAAQILAYLRGNVTAFPSGSTCSTSTCGPGLLNAGLAVAAAAPAVVTVPGAPTIGTATGGDASATVTWTAPASDGGSAITGYQVTPYIGSTPQTVRSFASTATSQVITGLTNAAPYTFKVAAVNSAGAGPLSAASNIVTPSPTLTAPGAPTIGVATGGNAQATLSWTAPASDGGSAITGYRVTPYIGATAQTVRSFASTATSQTITGLTNGSTYSFKVAAVNAVGVGADSLASNAVLVAGPATVPSAPTGVLAGGADASAAVSWTAPSSNGGSAITGYRVTPRIGGVAQPVRTFASTATSQTITGLTNGTTYTFTVAADNAVGTGPESAPSSPVTPTAYTPPVTPPVVIDTTSPTQAFVKAAYTDFLGRAPSATELAEKAAAIDGGTLTRRHLVDELAGSPEWVSAIVNQLYKDTLGRSGEAGGVAYWTGRIQDGSLSVAQVAAHFYASSEYFTGIGGGTNTSWVTDLYAKVLKRPADAAGVAYWSGQAATQGRTSVAYRLYQSSESRHMRVAMLYVKLLGRAPDAAGWDYWADRIEADGDIALASDLAASTEYLHRADTRFP